MEIITLIKKGCTNFNVRFRQSQGETIGRFRDGRMPFKSIYDGAILVYRNIEFYFVDKELKQITVYFDEWPRLLREVTAQLTLHAIEWRTKYRRVYPDHELIIHATGKKELFEFHFGTGNYVQKVVIKERGDIA